MQTQNHDACATLGGIIEKNHVADDAILIERIDQVLPQTQCQQCGYAGCKPYATAIVQGEAKINQCPPGGDAGIHALATLLNVDYLPLNTAHGMTKPKALAVIDELRCIGCTLCIQACPVDAILGASRQMHTVISGECTGCELCLAPCPVDCIIMSPDETQPALAANKAAADLARHRHQNRQARILRDKLARTQTGARKKQPLSMSGTQPASASPPSSPDTDAIKKTAIAAAMARVKAQKVADTKPDQNA
jgi:electron transport complex protein RnfB